MRPTLATLRGVIWAMTVLTVIVFTGRIGVRLQGTPNVVAADWILLVAFLCFLGMAILYLVTIGPIYQWQSATSGETAMYPNYVKDLILMRKVMLINSYMLWFTLWAVKLAFLSLYWKLVRGMPFFVRVWWIVFVFVVLTFIGNVPAHLVSCRRMDFFEAAGCNTREDQIGQLTSLYYSFAADVATDLAIMFLPLAVIRKLQVSRPKKMGVAGLFSIGWICIAIAIIRVIKLGEGQGQFIPGWLAMWGTIEGAIAVMVGCGPGLYVSAKEAYRSRTEKSYGSGLSHGPGKVFSGNKWSGKSWTRVGEPVKAGHGEIEVSSRFELRETGKISPSEGDDELLAHASWPSGRIQGRHVNAVYESHVSEAGSDGTRDGRALKE